MKDSFNELTKIENELSLLKKRKSDLIKTNSYKTQSKYRKERARRLIETGALAEKYFDIGHLSIQDREDLFKMFSDFVIANTPKKYRNKKGPQ